MRQNAIVLIKEAWQQIDCQKREGGVYCSPPFKSIMPLFPA
jgi:hypothetical protein